MVDSKTNYARVEFKVNGVVQAITRSAPGSEFVVFLPCYFLSVLAYELRRECRNLYNL